MTATDEERKKAAARLREKLNLTSEDKDRFSATHPLVESYQILEKIMEFFSNCDNEAFSQLDKGEFKNLYVDETKQFAEAYQFADNPMPNLDRRLEEHGIFKERKKISIIMIDGKEMETEETIQEPIRHTIRPLKTFAQEWMRKRHPVNRLRVEEFIKLARAARGGEFLERNITNHQQEGQSLLGRRII